MLHRNPVSMVRGLRLGLLSSLILAWCSLASGQTAGPAPQPLPGTEPLTMTGDIAGALVAGVDRFLLRKIDESTAKRARHWKRDFRSAEAYNASVEPNRKRLAHILGVRDARVPFDGPQLVGTIGRPDLLASCDEYNVFAVRWPAFGDVTGEGLLLEPGDRMGVADVVVDPRRRPDARAARRAGPGRAGRVAGGAAAGRERLPGDRAGPDRPHRRAPQRPGEADQPRVHLSPGVRAGPAPHRLRGAEGAGPGRLVRRSRPARTRRPKIGVFGYGEGGAIALYAAALDPRIDAVCVSGYFDDRNDVWTQPIDRNVFGLLEQFGDAELASLVAPRPLDRRGGARAPSSSYPAGHGRRARAGSPRPGSTTVEAEVERARDARRRPQAAPPRSSWSPAARRHRAVRVRPRP